MKGNISINRFTSNEEPRHGVTIQVQDSSSRVRFLEITMSIEDFAQALFGVSSMDCDFELRGKELVGSFYQNKTEDVPVGDFWHITDKGIDEILSRYEVEGWIGRREDFKNHHKLNRDGTVSVSFHRHVWISEK